MKLAKLARHRVNCKCREGCEERGVSLELRAYLDESILLRDYKTDEYVTSYSWLNPRL